ncbi:cellulose biosynthesis cyclic di-GMP-binding regulatory protein BcsB [Paenibacillus oenotherae]|uniref:Cellulose biosynthesis cyclic di-GMP-binding regulatory protein BcsB n=1 Tax=Paenibacillus oenotherae TaxID=1435645 RepID=A0ABS7D994_9BACL|nr:cellulose biosynthesis cyclic di-GMP-binding regulatory protein BcsB [Paenibacillus oenotherae]MBW7476445.1 cellulose biosynthesis cyclic di-GMP-binding regulatory protein BcsB [Paenibacillus oenotherae]
MRKVGILVVLFMLLLGACGSQETGDESVNEPAAHNHTANSSQQGGGAGTTAETADTAMAAGSESPKKPESGIEEKQYKIDGTMEFDGEKYSIAATTDLTLSKANYGGEHIYGEGHIHVYLNGKVAGPIVDDQPFPINDLLLKEGSNTIKIVLAGNNHSEPYNAEKSFPDIVK